MRFVSPASGAAADGQNDALTSRADESLLKQLQNYRLTTAKILYHLPDHPALLQEYIWQKLDQAPDFPELKRFLNFWERSLDGRLHSVLVASADLITPGQWRAVDGEWVH